MRKITTVWQQFFDVRPGERLRTFFMFLYLLCVLFAYYILKPVSRAMFLNRFDLDDLPWLYVLIAAAGGLLAYLYSRLAVKTSLKLAVFLSMALSVACLVVMWYLIRLHLPWMIYVLNVWVSLFSVVLVSQGWLVASNLFNAREAKRVYTMLVLGMVLGAAFGGEFTNRTAALVGTPNLLLASAAMVILAYLAFRLAIAQQGVSLTGARAAGPEGDVEFSFRDVVADIGRTRHLQVIIGIMMMTFIVDVLVEYQFQAMAKAAYKGDQLTAFFGRFYGLYLNLTEFVFQFFLTAVIVARFGVGGTLQIMPASITLASLGTVFASSVHSAAAVRLTEASTRYTLNRTGMELLYMPLPQELRNRIKAFIDIFVDRMSRGLGGMLLVLLANILDFNVRQLALVVVGFTIPWILLSRRARTEYVATIRRRLASQRLDLESARITVRDRETVALLEQTAASENPRQVSYALSLLSEAPRYDLRPQLRKLAGSPHAEVRAKVFALARSLRFSELLDAAARENNPAAKKAAIAYVLAVSPDAARLAREYLEDEDPRVVAGALEALADAPELARDSIAEGWLKRNARDNNPRRRALAAVALGILGDQGTEALHRLLEEEDSRVVAAACRAAGKLRNRAYVHALIRLLSDPRARGAAIDSLAQYGAAICGTLGDVLEDQTLPVRLRRHVPRVLRLIPDQRAVDVLLRALGQQDLAIRSSILKALNRLRETAPRLNFEDTFVTQQILAEARYYFGLVAALEPFRKLEAAPRSAVELLARTIEERLQQSLERLFRLLGLKYPPKEIYSAYLAVNRRRTEEVSAALEFLDNVMEKDLKRILIPLLDAPENAFQKGRDLFGLEIPDAPAAIRELIRSGDPWLMACSMAAAAELGMRELAPEIARAAQRVESEVYEVAQAAQEVLA